MDYTRSISGMWTSINRGVVFSPMVSSFGGGSIRGFNGGGGGGPSLPAITQLSDILSSINSGINGSDITHNGYGFMLYTGEHAGAGANYTATMDVSELSTIRFVLMGGGGAASALNVKAGSSSGGIEGLLDVSGQTAITLTVGSGGQASGSVATAGTGGDSSIKFGSTVKASAEGGLQSGASGFDSTRPTTSTSSEVTVISRADGGLGGSSRPQSSREPSVVTSATLSGAYEHGACAGQHGTDLSGDTALGYGGGGGGTYSSTTASPGGPLGYKGGIGVNTAGEAAAGPSVSAGTSYGKNSIGLQGYTDPIGGGGGGAFGGSGLEVYDIAQGASGLVKIWWAANDGDGSKLSTVGNLYS